MSKFVITALFIISTSVAACYIFPQYQKNMEIRKSLESSADELKSNNKEINKRRTLINDLKDNPEAITRIAREKFGFCGRGERVYKFTDEDELKKSKDN